MDFIFSVVGGIFWASLLLGPPAIVLFFKHRFPFFPGRNVFEVQIYQLKEGRRRDMTGHVREEDIKLERTKRAWKHIDKKVPYCWIETGFMQGFDYDASAFVVARPSGKSGLIRLLELSPSVNSADNFVLIDIPAGMDESKVRAAISQNSRTALEAIRTENTRTSGLNPLYTIGLPALGIVALVVIVILTLQWATGYMQNITNAQTDRIVTATTSSARQIVYACGGQFYDPTIENKTQPQPAQQNVIPFIG